MRGVVDVHGLKPNPKDDHLNNMVRISLTTVRTQDTILKAVAVDPCPG